MRNRMQILTLAILICCLGQLLAASQYSAITVPLYGDDTGIVYYNQVEIINTNSSPVKITHASAMHIPSETAMKAKMTSDILSRYLSDDEILNLARYKNEALEISIDAAGSDAVAVKFGVVVIDAFKEYLGGLTAITMDPPTTGMEWTYSPSYLFKAEKFGVVCVFVRQVRLSNGDIWNFDPQQIANGIKKFTNNVSQDDIINFD